MEVLQFFGSWDQKIYSWFMNHKPLIPTLHTIEMNGTSTKTCLDVELAGDMAYFLKLGEYTLYRLRDGCKIWSFFGVLGNYWESEWNFSTPLKPQQLLASPQLPHGQLGLTVDWTAV